MGDCDHGLGPPENRCHRLTKGCGVERSKALVEHEDRRSLQQRSGDEDSAALAVGKLPAALADGLFDACRHSNEQFAEAEFDSVVSLYALRHFPDPEQALREMFRCSAPGSQTLVAVGSAPPPGSRAFFNAGTRLVADRIMGLAGRAPLYATAFLDRLIERTVGNVGHDEHAGWTHGVKQFSGTVSALMQRVGYEKIHSSWVGHTAVLDSAQDFWTLQVTLSSFARKRMQAVTPVEYKDLRTKFDAICNRHLARGGRLIYKSGALITTGRRPAR